jgi:adenosine deaminase
VREAIEHLGVHRIDHGIRAREDPALLRQLADTGIGLAVCPLSNWRLQVYQRFCGGANPIGDLLRGGTPLCLNSGACSCVF